RAIEYVKDLAEFFPLSDGTKISASQFMEKFGFSAQQQFTPLSRLSGGEKRRLHLLSILFRNPNFLVLDEPTNDLDLPTLRTLEEFLAHFQGCILIVSHDRYFMDRIVDHLFVFEGEGVIRDFPGNYSQYRLEKLREESLKEPLPVKAVDTKPKNDRPPSAKVTFREKHEFETLEKEIPLLEQEKAALEKQLQDGTLPFETLQEASRQIGNLMALLDQKEMRWLELSEKMEGHT
ncbi:MAG: ABC-F family ATP-binding cassette domain-containing protein, partial [Bacteroidota bacterium]|nr:ABC-F family ATP-binding cassette domain-containing protein [Bacteroidota bacterium]